MNNKELFIQAFLEADRIETEKYYNKDSFHYEFSKAFEKKMNRLIAKHNRISIYTRKRISRVLIAAIVAIIIMITGLMSVSASRERIIEFVENIFSQYTQIELSKDSPPTPDTIETAYTIGSIPKEFKLKEYNVNETNVFAIWTNSKGEEIVFSQDILDSEISIDNEHNYERLMINGFPAYKSTNTSNSFITWCNGNYWYTISVPINYKDELIIMAESIQKK